MELVLYLEETLPDKLLKLLKVLSNCIPSLQILRDIKNKLKGKIPEHSPVRLKLNSIILL